MAALMIIYWRDIPAQVMAREGRRSAKRELPERFSQAIDRAAMRAGLHESDAYLAQWRRAPAGPCGDDLETAAAQAAARLEQDYDATRLAALVDGLGLE